MKNGEYIPKIAFWVVILGFIILLILVWPQQQPPMSVEIQDLATNPQEYTDKTIRTTGYAEYVGSKSYFIVIPYYDPELSLAEVKRTTYLLHESKDASSKSITMIDKDGPLLIPILPIVPAPGKVYHNYLEVVGTFMKDERQDKYFLDVHSVEEIKP